MKSLKGTIRKTIPQNVFHRWNHAEALITQAADCFRLGEAEFNGALSQKRVLVMELLHRYSGLKQRMIPERFGDG